MKKRLFYLVSTIAITTVLLLGGCGGKPKVKPPTIVNVEIVTSEQLNPDDTGRASPVTLRIYGLNSLGNFNAIDFFSLYDNDQQALGKTVTMSDELHLKPGSKKIYTHELPQGTLYLGVVAAFRDIETAVWRDSVAVPVERTTNFLIQLDADNISLHVQ